VSAADPPQLLVHAQARAGPCLSLTGRDAERVPGIARHPFPTSTPTSGGRPHDRRPHDRRSQMAATSTNRLPYSAPAQPGQKCGPDTPGPATDHPLAAAAAEIAATTWGVLARGANNTSQASHERSIRTPASQLVVLISTTPSLLSDPAGPHRNARRPPNLAYRSISQEGDSAMWLPSQLTGS
jgi:hypothetical protein